MSIESAAPSPASFPHLPPELESFLSGAIPQSLTVRGAPGVGKTTFALTVLAAFRGSRTMVTTRVPADVLRRQVPWIDSPAGRTIHLAEFLRFRTKPIGGVESVDQLRQTLQARASDLVDVSQVLNLPSTLAEALGNSPASSPQLIAIDSWEAWVENILGSSTLRIDAPTTRWELERTMLDRLLATGASVLMVVERDERTRFDYVTDGSVLLTASEVDGREERWIEITKLRGVRIRSRSYPFTLEGARFRAILRPTSWSIEPAMAEADPDPDAPTLWPGSAEFANHFGRIPSVGPLLIETDPEIPVRSLWRLVACTVASCLASSGRSVVCLPNTLTPKDLWPSLRDLTSAIGVAERLRLVVPTGGALPEGAPRGVFVPSDRIGDAGRTDPSIPVTPVDSAPPSSGEGQFDPAEFLHWRASARTRNLLVIFPSTTIDLGPDHHPDPNLLIPSKARRVGAEFSTLVVMRSDDPFLNEGRMRAAVHMLVRARRGQILMCGVRPWTPSLVFRPGYEAGTTGRPYELIPIV